MKINNFYFFVNDGFARTTERKVDDNDRSRARGWVDRGWKRKFLFRKLPRHYPNHRGQRGQGGESGVVMCPQRSTIVR